MLPNPTTTITLQSTPRLPAPGDADYATCRNRKRLIILCDGTCEDSLSDSTQVPTNISRLARALSPNAWIPISRRDGKREYEQIEQIVHYQAGPGTNGNFLLGAPFGTGLSEIVRSAYGFLCCNYNYGDKIYFFGFSRGAYIARSIAGLVAEHGLLSKRGLDNFHTIYKGFYNEHEQIDTGDRIDYRLPTPEKLGLQSLPRGTVEVVGVFDTIGFHNPIISRLNQIFHGDMSIGGDKNEFPNTLLSENVKYAFHALALDETRIPYQTTLFFQSKSRNSNTKDQKTDWNTTLKQVWFSGAHSDVGGGSIDPRLSNISLMWMISELVSRKILEFDQNYLLDEAVGELQLWGTAAGASKPKPKGILSAIVSVSTPIAAGLKNTTAWTLNTIFRNPILSRKSLGVRTPGLYIPRDADGRNGDPQDFETNEEIHASIQQRNLKSWPCKPLAYLGAPQGQYFERAIPPQSRKGRSVAISKSILQRPASVIEKAYRGRVRDANKAPVAIPQETEVVPVTEKVLPNPAENPFRSKTPSFDVEAQYPTE